MTDFDTARAALEAARRAGAASAGSRSPRRSGRELALRRREHDAAIDRRGAADDSRAGARAARAAEEAGLRARRSMQRSAGRQRGRRRVREGSPTRARRSRSWSDETPVLLLPVRLETRFKTVADERQPTMSSGCASIPTRARSTRSKPSCPDVEVESARRFWIETWAAGGIEAQRARGVARSRREPRRRPRRVDRPRVRAGQADDAPDEGGSRRTSCSSSRPRRRRAAEDARRASAYWKAVWRRGRRRRRGERPRRRRSPPRRASPTPTRSIARHSGRPTSRAAPQPPATPSRRRRRRSLAHAAACADAKTRSWTRAGARRDAARPLRGDRLPGRRVVFEAVGAAGPVAADRRPGPLGAGRGAARARGDGELRVPDELRWMVDFEAAVVAGMGSRCARPRAAPTSTRPLQRLIALGVRLADERAGRRCAWRSCSSITATAARGLALVPQGTPTNNTDEARRATAARTMPTRPTTPCSAQRGVLRGHGRRLVDCGRRPVAGRRQWVSIRTMLRPRAARRTARTAPRRARCNRALWPATFGYALETMLHPVLDADAGRRARAGSTRTSSRAAGRCRALRIGDQPYGVLPTSAISRWDWLDGDDARGRRRAAHAGRLHRLPRRARARARDDARGLGGGSRRRSASSARRAIRTSCCSTSLGLHPGVGRVPPALRGEPGAPLQPREARRASAAQIAERDPVDAPAGSGARAAAPARLHGEVEPGCAVAVLLHAGQPAQRADRRRPSALRARAGPRLHRRRAQLPRVAASTPRERHSRSCARSAGSRTTRLPTALLYVLLRHALLLGYWDSSLRLHRRRRGAHAERAARARREAPFVHVPDEPARSREPLRAAL